MKTRAGKDEDWYAISRAKDRRGGCVFVVAVKRYGLTVSNSFSASRHGSEEAALSVARQWRNRVLANLPPITYRQLFTRVRKNSTSGIRGVRREVKRSGAYWVATCTSVENPSAKHFSVDKYGEKRAKELAIQARNAMLDSVPDKLWLASPAARAMSQRDFECDERAGGGVSWDGNMQQQLVSRLRAAGLIGKPQTPSVRRRDYPSQSGPVWEAMFEAPNGQKIFRRFSVSKYGEETAARLAEEAYAKLEAEYSSSNAATREVRISERLAEAPDKLFDVVQQRLGLRSDAAVARTLGVAAPTISKVRRGALPLGAALLVRILEATELHIRSLYGLVVVVLT